MSHKTENKIEYNICSIIFDARNIIESNIIDDLHRKQINKLLDKIIYHGHIPHNDCNCGSTNVKIIDVVKAIINKFFDIVESELNNEDNLNDLRILFDKYENEELKDKLIVANKIVLTELKLAKRNKLLLDSFKSSLEKRQALKQISK